MVMQVIEVEEQRARASSFAIARFALTQISSKAKIGIEDFMPYPNPSKSTQGPGEGIQPRTVAVLRGLIKSRAMPSRVEAAAIRAIGGLGDG